MRKAVVALGLLSLLFVLSVPQLVVSQMPEPAAPPATGRSDIDPGQLRLEIALLRLINEMGLSRDQLAMLKEVVSDLRASRDGVLAAQRELRAFLVRFQGEPGEFQDAVKPFDEKVAQARSAFRETLRGSVERVKGLLTIKQGEIVREFLRARVEGFFEERHDAPSRISVPKGMGEFELHIETDGKRAQDFMERFEEKTGALKARLRDFFDRFGVTFDEEDFEHRMDPMPGPMLRLRERPRLPIVEIGFLSECMERFVLRHLDVLERVLDEKLQAISATRS